MSSHEVMDNIVNETLEAFYLGDRGRLFLAGVKAVNYFIDLSAFNWDTADPSDRSLLCAVVKLKLDMEEDEAIKGVGDGTGEVVSEYFTPKVQEINPQEDPEKTTQSHDAETEGQEEALSKEDTGEGKEDEKEDDGPVNQEEKTGLGTHDDAEKKETFAEKDAVTNPLLSMGKEELKSPPKSPNSTNAPRAAEGQFYNVFAGEQQQQQQQLTRFPSFITSEEHGHFPGRFLPGNLQSMTGPRFPNPGGMERLNRSHATITPGLVRRRLYAGAGGGDSDSDEPVFAFERITTVAEPETIASALISDKASKKILSTFVREQFSSQMQPTISLSKLDDSFASPRSQYKRSLESVSRKEDDDTIDDKRRKLDVASMREKELQTLIRSFKDVQSTLTKEIKSMEEQEEKHKRDEEVKKEREEKEAEEQRRQKWEARKSELRSKQQEELIEEAKKIGVKLTPEEAQLQTIMSSPPRTPNATPKKVTPRKPKTTPQSPHQKGAQMVRLAIQREFDSLAKADSSSENVDLVVVKIEASFDDVALERDQASFAALRVFLQNSQTRGEAAKLEKRQMTQSTTYDSTVPYSANMFFDCVVAGMVEPKEAATLREEVASFIAANAEYVQKLGPDLFVSKKDNIHAYVGKLISGETHPDPLAIFMTCKFIERKTTLISGSSQWFSAHGEQAYLGLPILVAPKHLFYNMKVDGEAVFVGPDRRDLILELETFGTTLGTDEPRELVSMLPQGEKSSAQASTSTSSTSQEKEAEIKTPKVEIPDGKFCDTCNRGFSTRSKFKCHFQAEHQGERVPCTFPNCTKTYTSEGNMKLHYKKHLGQYLYPCQYCEKGYMNKGDFDSHMTHHTKESIECTSCSKTYRTKSGYNKHFERCDGGGGSKKIACIICGSEVTREYLTTHISQAHGDAQLKSFERCDLCGEEFENIFDRLEHKCTKLQPTPVKTRSKAGKK